MKGMISYTKEIKIIKIEQWDCLFSLLSLAEPRNPEVIITQRYSDHGIAKIHLNVPINVSHIHLQILLTMG